MSDRMCSIAGCETRIYGRGWCRLHYQRWYRHGDPLYERTDASRFWANVDKDGPIPEHRPDLGPCWIWTGQTHKRDGYGRHTVNSDFVQAHRFACELEDGPLPSGTEPDHLCRVRPCVRRSHLEVVPSRENWLRSRAPSALNHWKTHCKYDHPLAGDNLYITPQGERQCRICRQRRSREYLERKRRGAA